jgi:hypothetical protein
MKYGYSITQRSYPVSVVFAALSVAYIWLALIFWRRWWNRRGKRAAQALGHKALAKLRELVSSMPRPALPRLRPEGASS